MPPFPRPRVALTSAVLAAALAAWPAAAPIGAGGSPAPSAQPGRDRPVHRLRAPPCRAATASRSNSAAKCPTPPIGCRTRTGSSSTSADAVVPGRHEHARPGTRRPDRQEGPHRPEHRDRHSHRAAVDRHASAQRRSRSMARSELVIDIEQTDRPNPSPCDQRPGRSLTSAPTPDRPSSPPGCRRQRRPWPRRPAAAAVPAGVGPASRCQRRPFRCP